MKWTAAAVMASVALAACGDSDPPDTAQPLSREEYQQELNGLLEQSSGPTSDYIQLVVRRRPQAECARMMRAFTRRLLAIEEQAAALHPPADAIEVHRRTLAAGGDSLERVVKVRFAVERGDIACGRELNAELYGLPSTARFEDGMRELEQLGYHLGLG